VVSKRISTDPSLAAFQVTLVTLTPGVGWQFIIQQGFAMAYIPIDPHTLKPS